MTHLRTGHTNFRRSANETDFVKKFDLSGQEVQFSWHVFPGASTTDLRKEIEKFLSAVEPENFRDRIIFMSKFNDIEYWRKEHKESCAQTVFLLCARHTLRTSGVLK